VSDGGGGGEVEVVAGAVAVAWSSVCAQVRRCLDLGIRRFRVGSLHGLAVLAGAGDDCRVSAGFPLPVANSAAVQLLLRRGVRRMTAWVELD
jgi:hypothetical protein